MNPDIERLAKEAGRKTYPVEALRELFVYEPETGVLRWRYDRQRVKAGDAARTVVDSYLTVKIDRVGYYVHRVAWAIHYGSWPKQQIDHINRDRKDNRICNLRDVSPAVNSNNKSRYFIKRQGFVGPVYGVGIRRDRRQDQAFTASIYVGGAHRYLGSFKTPAEASTAYAAAYASLKNSMPKGEA